MGGSRGEGDLDVPEAGPDQILCQLFKSDDYAQNFLPVGEQVIVILLAHPDGRYKIVSIQGILGFQAGCA